MKVKQICTTQSWIFFVGSLSLWWNQTWLIFSISWSRLTWICFFILISGTWFSLRILSGCSMLLRQRLVVLGGHKDICMGWWKEACHFNLGIRLNLDHVLVEHVLQLVLFAWRIRTLKFYFSFCCCFNFLLNCVLSQNIFLWTRYWGILWLCPLHYDSIPFLWTAAGLFTELSLFTGLLGLQQLLLAWVGYSILRREISFEFLLLHLLILRCFDGLLLLLQLHVLFVSHSFVCGRFIVLRGSYRWVQIAEVNWIVIIQWLEETKHI